LLNGASPKELAPGLYQVTRFKNRSVVYTKLQNMNRIRCLGNIQSTSLLEEFTILFMALDEVHLSQENDEIKWNWTSDGKYAGFLLGLRYMIGYSLLIT
jgi:hypothetical protein